MMSTGSAGLAPPAARVLPLDDPLPLVRSTVRDVLLAAPTFHELPPADRRRLAEAMVTVCNAAASLLREEIESDHAAQLAMQQTREAPPGGPRRAARPALATAQNAGSEFSGVSAERVA